jgi:hypothetical protein
MPESASRNNNKISIRKPIRNPAAGSHSIKSHAGDIVLAMPKSKKKSEATQVTSFDSSYSPSLFLNPKIMEQKLAAEARKQRN